jgi:hypothetical protein
MVTSGDESAAISMISILTALETIEDGSPSTEARSWKLRTIRFTATTV